jgi:predicted ribosomally synthesized peptide with nif11-like leader
MSMYAAQQFMSQVRNDAALGQQIIGTDNNLGAMLKVAEHAGFKFSTDEFMAAIEREWIQANEKLTEGDLYTVAGKVYAAPSTKAAAGACYTLGNGPDCRIR